jgi:cell division septation protein DedD
MTRIVPAVLLALGVVLSLAHSGRSAPPSVGLVAKEFLFDPKDITVGTGEIVFVVKNQGAIEHNVVLESPGGETVAQIAIIQAGQTRTVTAFLPAGIYTLYCSLPGHRYAGMTASLRAGSSTAFQPRTATPSRPSLAPGPPAPSPLGPAPARSGNAGAAPHPAAPAAVAGRPEFHVQAGAFRQRKYADELVQQLRARGYAATMVEGPLFRVRVGPAMNRAAAEQLAATLRSKGFEAMLTPVQ